MRCVQQRVQDHGECGVYNNGRQCGVCNNGRGMYRVCLFGIREILSWDDVGGRGVHGGIYLYYLRYITFILYTLLLFLFTPSRFYLFLLVFSVRLCFFFTLGCLLIASSCLFIPNCHTRFSLAHRCPHRALIPNPDFLRIYISAFV